MIAGRVFDPDGKPLENFYFAAQAYNLESWRQGQGAAFELKGHTEDKPMTILFAHRERNLAGSVVVSGRPPKNLKVKLQPAGKVVGRLIESDGEPIRKAMLTRLSTNFGLYDSRDKVRLSPPLPPKAPNTPGLSHDTDDDGRFEIGGLAPGVEYRIAASASSRKTTAPYPSKVRCPGTPSSSSRAKRSTSATLPPRTKQIRRSQQ